MNGEGGESAHNSLSVTKVTELSVSSTAPTLSSSLLERLFPFSQLPLCLWRSHDTVLANQMQAAPPITWGFWEWLPPDRGRDDLVGGDLSSCLSSGSCCMGLLRQGTTARAKGPGNTAELWSSPGISDARFLCELQTSACRFSCV